MCEIKRLNQMNVPMKIYRHKDRAKGIGIIMGTPTGNETTSVSNVSSSSTYNPELYNIFDKFLSKSGL